VTRRLSLALVALALALAVTACTAPGEPPPSPDAGAYQDVMRRELSGATSALATMQLTLSEARDGGITDTYALAIVHQSQTDLVRVTTDLRQIAPPAGFQAAHRRLIAVTVRAGRDVAAAGSAWSSAVRRASAARAIGADLKAVDDLTARLGV
jgi:hypothetical protein